MSFLDVTADDGDYLYEPRFFCFECWEETRDDCRGDHEDFEPFPDNMAAFKCELCDSDIRFGEYVGLVGMGELRCSPRTPNGETTNVFTHVGATPIKACLPCIAHINKGIGLWSGDVDQEGSCEDGTRLRCWRTGCATHCERTGKAK